MKIGILKAENGDAVLISSEFDGKNFHVLIDGGPRGAWEVKDKKKKRTQKGALQVLIGELKAKGEVISLLVLTHIDDDHINGLLRWFAAEEDIQGMVKEVWFNSGRLISEDLEIAYPKEMDLKLPHNGATETSTSQGENFEDIIQKESIWKRKLFFEGKAVDIGPFHFDFLSPNQTGLKKLLKQWKKEQPNTFTSGQSDYKYSLSKLLESDKFESDSAVPNMSSLAFIIREGDKSILYLGDSLPTTISDALEKRGYHPAHPLKVDAVKVSHHGSKGNTSPKLLSLVESKKFIISTNGKGHGHPDKVCLARIITAHPKAELIFNYPDLAKEIFSDEDHSEYQFEICDTDQPLIL